MRKTLSPLFLLLSFPLFLAAQPRIQLVDWASGFERPVDIAHCGDNRMFVVEQDGVIWVLDSLGNRLDTFLNIDPRVNSTNNEQGLLGLAFHPNYAQNGYFFVYYIKNSSGATQVSRFSVKQGNANEADPNSELPVLTVSQPFSNHNGGCVKFGPDGYLYIGLGDGGSAGDPQGNGQKKNTHLGKMLRIDVNNSSSTTPYAIPPDNPFVGQTDYFPEIWSLGLRNPWRFSFDRTTGDLWIGDVGQNAREEVDFEPAGTGGRNYGWKCYEGPQPYSTSGCQPASAYVSPVFSYANPSIGCSITGGFIYRGYKYPDLQGVYLNADYCSGRIWATKKAANGTFSSTELANLGDYEFSTFGEDRSGELYVALLTSGKVQRIIELCSPFQVAATHIISPVCHLSFGGSIELGVTNGIGNIAYAWSNNQSSAQNVYLNPGAYTVTVTNGNGCSRIQTYTIEQEGPNVPVLSASDTVLCFGQNTALTASGLTIPNQLNWYQGNTLIQTTNSVEPNYSITVPGGGNYFVQAVDSLCNLSSQTLTINTEFGVEPSIGLSGDTLFSSAPGSSCQWLFNNQPIPGATGPTYVAVTSGIYELEITSPNGCTYQSSGVQVTISETALPSSVVKFSLSPNPTNDTALLQMELVKVEHFTLSMSDTSQRQIFMQTQQTAKFSQTIDLRALPSGTYFLLIQTETGNFVRKIIKR